VTRLLALLAAAVMVVGAIVVRGLVDDDGGGDSEGGSGDTVELVCGTDLLAACNLLAEGDGGPEVVVTAEDEAVTAQRLADGDPVLDDGTAWLAAGPWPAIAEAGGAELPSLSGSETLARSPAVIVARDDRMSALEAACGTVTWACIGDGAGADWADLGGEATWGRVEVGLPSTARGDGSAAVNQAVASRVGRSDFATNDLEDPAVDSWFARLADESGANATGTTPLARFLSVPGSLGVVGASEAEAVDALSSAASAGDYVVVAPEPVVTSDVRLWAGSDDALGAALDRLGPDRLASALGRAGWRTAGGAATAGADADSMGADLRSAAVALPDGDGLPAPGVVATVNRRWDEG
jgi:hypothetical protein